uniref:Retinoic acid receptor responder protein 2 n=1 Tax=Neogobius melanostomus TaxID=47308 RepID=A0A8C6U6A3_9GOBI
MATVAQLLLFSALLYVAAAQNPYNDLPVGYRRGVDLALEQLNSSTAVPHHYRLFWTVEKTESDSGQGLKYLYHHFRLKPTRCAKGTTGTNAQRCPFRNDRPLMDCVTCYKTSSDQIEQIPEPYVNCIQKPRVTEEIKSARIDHCKKMAYVPGASSLVFRGLEKTVDLA